VLLLAAKFTPLILLLNAQASALARNRLILKSGSRISFLNALSMSPPSQSGSALVHVALLRQWLLCLRSPPLHVRRWDNAALSEPLQNRGAGHCFLFLFCFEGNNSPLWSHFGSRNRLLINLTALGSPSQMLALEGEKKRKIYYCIEPFHPREPSKAHVVIIHR